MSNIETPEARKIVRAWAVESGHDVSARGAISEKVREAYVSAHMGEPAYVIGSKPNRGAAGWRIVTVMCPRCANTHEHGSENGERGNIGHRVQHCWNPVDKDKFGGYYLQDDTPLEDWEVGN